MSENLHISDLIERYLEGSLAGDDLVDFESKMNSDEDLRLQVEQAKLTNEALYFASLAELREQIGTDISQVAYSDESNNKKWWIAGVGTLALLASLLAWKLGSPDNDVSEVTPTTGGTARVEKKAEKRTTDQTNTSLTEVPEVSRFESKEDKALVANVDQDREESQVELESKDKVVVSAKSEKQELKDSLTEKKSLILRPAPCTRDYEIETKESCRGKSTGEIEILQGVQDIVEISFDGDVSTDLRYEVLEAGSYDLHLELSSDCSFEETVTVAHKWCPLNENFSFNPSAGQEWRFNYEDGDIGQVKIFSSLGKEVFASRFDGDELTWAGQDQNGGVVATDVYIAIVSYSDGRKEKIEITVVN